MWSPDIDLESSQGDRICIYCNQNTQPTNKHKARECPAAFCLSDAATAGCQSLSTKSRVFLPPLQAQTPLAILWSFGTHSLALRQGSCCFPHTLQGFLAAAPGWLQCAMEKTGSIQSLQGV